MKTKTLDMVYTALFSVLIAICSWIQVPMVVPITLQTFAVFLACLVLGGRLGTLSILIYILLGAVGVPVFSGFRGGIGALLGSTGGYIIGFIFTALVMWLSERLVKQTRLNTFITMFIGMLMYFSFGTAWFMFVYIRDKGNISLISVLSMCVFPFIIPDIIKIILAYVIKERLIKVIPLRNNKS